MRKPFIYCIALLGVILAGCAEEPGTPKETCYVSILPIRYIVQEIVGPDLNIEVLVPPGASPETFEPTPKQFVKLQQAPLIFNVGLIDFETTLLAKIQNPAKIVDLSRGIQLIEGTCAHGKSKGRSDKGMDRPEHDHGHDHGVDPHVWTSPKALKIMAKNAFTAIREQYPDSVRYRDNFEHLIQKIDELDARTRQKIELSGVKYFIVYHPALTYYARDYYQNQFPKSVVEVIAQDMEAEYIEIDPLDEQVLENIDRITDLITQP